MIENDSGVVFVLPGDFPYDDLLQVALKLETADPFVPGFIPPEVGLYDIQGQLYASMSDGKALLLLPDRNIVSRLAKAVLGEPVDEQQRLAAAVLAFAQCLDIQIEPSIAFHEVAPVQGNAAAHEELARFRLADNRHPTEWIDVALGRTDRLPALQVMPSTGPILTLDRKLNRWRKNYVAALKIGALELEPLPPVHRVLRLLDWMYSDFILAGPAAMFACHYFSPRFPRKGLLKYLRSPDRDRALQGIANATWDLTHLSEFVRLVMERRETTQIVFASLDEGLRRIARTLFNDPRQTARNLAPWWPEAEAHLIAKRLLDYLGRVRDPSWHEAQRNRQNSIEEFTLHGEAEIRAWSPTLVDARA